MDAWLDRVHQGDCLELLLELPDGCVDAAVTDPPYGISSLNAVRVRTVPGAGKHESGLSVFENVGGDYGSEDREVGMGWIEQVARLLRPGGSLLVFCADRQWQPTRDAAEAAGLQVRHSWFWCKTNPPPTPRENMVSAVELGWWFRKPGAPPTWTGGHTCPNWFQGPHHTGTYSSGARVHPMQKPDWLLRRMIELWTVEGDIVLDPFAGSASCGVAAIALGRHFVGIEIDPEHADAGNRRLESVRREVAGRLPLEASNG